MNLLKLNIITSNVYSYAVDQGDVGLQNHMLKSTNNYILQNKDENFVTICTGLDTTIAALIVADPAGTADYFTAAEAALAMNDVVKFDSTLGVYKNAIEEVNKAKQEFAISWIPKIKIHLKALKGLLPGVITTTYLPFVQTYIGLDVLVNAGRRKQGVDAVMKDADGNVIVLIGTMEVVNYPVVKVPKKAKNDSNGVFKLMSLKIGTWNVRFSAPGYKDQIIIVKTVFKDVVHLTVTMVAV